MYCTHPTCWASLYTDSLIIYATFIILIDHPSAGWIINWPCSIVICHLTDACWSWSSAYSQPAGSRVSQTTFRCRAPVCAVVVCIWMVHRKRRRSLQRYELYNWIMVIFVRFPKLWFLVLSPPTYNDIPTFPCIKHWTHFPVIRINPVTSPTMPMVPELAEEHCSVILYM